MTTSFVETAATSSSDAAGISLLSFNVWGIFAAQRVKDRMPRIAEAIADYDIVCLQEQFDAADAATLFANREAFPYVHRFRTAVVGSGLTIASKFPIISNYFVPFRAGGRIERFWEGDALANKGISVSRVAVPRWRLDPTAPSMDASGGEVVEVVIFNTHLIAQYQQYSAIGGYHRERNAAHRLVQAHQLAQLVVSTVTPGATPFILCGDFNAGLASHEMNLLGAYLELYGLGIQDAIEEPTYDEFNVYNKRGAGTYLEMMSMTEDIPVQLDHVMFGKSLLAVVPESAEVCMKQKITFKDGVVGQLSDHYGVTSRFTLVQQFGSPLTKLAAIEHGRRLKSSQLPKATRDALVFAETFITDRIVEKRRSVKMLTLTALMALVVGFFVVPWIASGVPAAVMSTVAGMVLLGCVLLGQLYRTSELIAMEGAAADLEALLTRDCCCASF